MLSSKEIEAAVKEDSFFWVKTLQRLYSSEDGKLALYWLINNAGLLDSFPDPILEAQNAGRRGLIGELLGMLRVDVTALAVEPEVSDLLDRILEN